MGIEANRRRQLCSRAFFNKGVPSLIRRLIYPSQHVGMNYMRFNKVVSLVTGSKCDHNLSASYLFSSYNGIFSFHTLGLLIEMSFTSTFYRFCIKFTTKLQYFNAFSHELRVTFISVYFLPHRKQQNLRYDDLMLEKIFAVHN
jgi:hypothetical protein